MGQLLESENPTSLPTGWSQRDLARDLLSERDRATTPAEPLGPSPEVAEPLENRGELGVTAEIGAATAPEKPSNEDRFAHGRNWAVVCDGIGSSKHGAEAAQIATDTAARLLDQLEPLDNREVAMKVMAEILEETHALILQAQASTGRTMATTISVVLLIQEGQKMYAVVGNVDHSPAYRIRKGKLQELTNYHEELPPQEQRPGVGKPQEFLPAIFCVRLKPGDRLLVTSNGLHKNDPTMEETERIMQETPDPQLAAERLVTEVTGMSADARTVVAMAV